MIISFAWTIDPLLAGLKTCTRRCWSETHFQRWVKAWREGRHIHEAWDRLPHIGGKRRAWIRLTCEPYQERLCDMPESDVEAEGGLWASKEEFISLFGDPEKVVAVVRFELAKEEIPCQNGN
jgi:hypothetical protein